MDSEKIINFITSCGAAHASVICQKQISLSADFRAICESNQCGGYDSCWMCPPCIGPIDELMAQVRSFPSAVLYQTIFEIEDSYDIEGMFEAGHKHMLVSQEIRERTGEFFHGPILHLTCGGCHLCPVCARRTNEPCRFPDKALSSLEGYGVDVYKTAKAAGLKYINGENTVTYFGMILFSEE